MSTPALNPLVGKIRGMHPGAYDDMDDAALTKAVLAKYPQYSDLAAPSVPRPALQMQEMPLSRSQRSLLPDEGLVGLAAQGREGYASDPDVSGAMSVAGIGTGAALMGASRALPFLGRAA